MKKKLGRLVLSRDFFTPGVMLVFLLFLTSIDAIAQTRPTFAVLKIDTKGLSIDPTDLGSIVRLELEKNKSVEVLDRYEMSEILAKSKVDVTSCYGRSCMVEVGKILKVQKMITGSAEIMNDKIIITLREVDVATESIARSSIMEYIKRQELLNRMVAVSLNDLFGIQNDQTLVDQLTQTEQQLAPITSYYKLNGPRIGLAFITGDMGETIKRPKAKGGFDGYPVLSQIGYQHEIQYLGAGNFMALVEFLGVISGMEQQMFIPNLVFTNGFRLNKQGLEIAFGPTFSLRKQATGFYDTDALMGGEAGEWYLDYEWYSVNPDLENPYINEMVDRMDSRGSVRIGTGWIWAIGKTFHSGYLNIPVNLYVSPKKEGWYIGLSAGFNVSSRTKK